MGRKPSVNHHLPPQMRARRRGDTTYYYYDTGERPRREIPLGKEYVLAVQKWSELHAAPAPVQITVGYAISQYLASDDFARISSGTQADYRYALDQLIEHFADAPMDEVRPPHLQLYIDKRGKVSMHRALREVAVLGMVYRYAMARDWTRENPVAAVRRKRLPGRKHVQITDAMLQAVYEKADEPLREAIDLAYFVSQRPADVLKIAETDIKDGYLAITQNKTGKVVKIPVIAGLAELLERIQQRKKKHPVRVLYLLTNEKGRPMTKSMLRARFEKARAEAGIAGKDFQFRDLRRKGGTDLREQVGKEAAQELLGHSTEQMTEHYTGTAGAKARAIPFRKKASAEGK